MASREIKKGLNECLRKYKIALGLEAVPVLPNNVDTNERISSEYAITVRGM
jgi:hypothetical protein